MFGDVRSKRIAGDCRTGVLVARKSVLCHSEDMHRITTLLMIIADDIKTNQLVKN
jgi:predicted hotdog family 3-hydroxylacyl-ACP dehydratase